MRFLAIADTHFGFEAGRTAEARKLTYEAMFNSFEKIISIAKEKKVDYILHGGDLFNRSKPRKKVVARTYELLEQLLNAEIGFMISPGNHERSKLPDTLLHYHDICHFFTESEIIPLDNCSILGFPFQKSATDAFNRKLKLICSEASSDPIICLCHQLFDGAVFGPNKFRFGLMHGAFDPLTLPMNIDLVISGHIHRAQTLQKNLIVYPGSLERTSFVETIEPKGYLLIDITSEKLSVRFNPLTTFPMESHEFDISDKQISHLDLQKIVKNPHKRILLRFIGRSLRSKEIAELKNQFPRSEFPLLTYTPKFPEQKLDPFFSVHADYFVPPVFEKSVN